MHLTVFFLGSHVEDHRFLSRLDYVHKFIDGNERHIRRWRVLGELWIFRRIGLHWLLGTKHPYQARKDDEEGCRLIGGPLHGLLPSPWYWLYCASASRRWVPV